MTRKMARNDSVVQQWYLLRKIEGPRGATLSELMEAVLQDYSRHPRTLHRDLEALELFFPICTERIDGANPLAIHRRLSQSSCIISKRADDADFYFVLYAENIDRSNPIVLELHFLKKDKKPPTKESEIFYRIGKHCLCSL
jgi:hypothetical protein